MAWLAVHLPEFRTELANTLVRISKAIVGHGPFRSQSGVAGASSPCRKRSRSATGTTGTDYWPAGTAFEILEQPDRLQLIGACLARARFKHPNKLLPPCAQARVVLAAS